MNEINRNKELTLEIPSRTELLTDVRKFVREAASKFGFVKEDSDKIELAVDEACTNIIKHAYRYNPNGFIRIQITRIAPKNQPKKFVIMIQDRGISFDVEGYTPTDMREYLRKPRRGGLGIVLMKKLMDEVEYIITPGDMNVIRLVKYLPRKYKVSTE